MNKEILVKEVKDIKNGVTGSNKPWTLSHVIADDGVRYSTFNGESYRGAVGKRITVNVESKPSEKTNPQTGKPYLNWSIVEPKTSKTGMSPEIVTKLFEALRRIEEKIDNLQLVEVRGEPASDGAEEIPF